VCSSDLAVEAPAVEAPAVEAPARRERHRERTKSAGSQ
jgi:hypothetical protein